MRLASLVGSSVLEVLGEPLLLEDQLCPLPLTHSLFLRVIFVLDFSSIAILRSIFAVVLVVRTFRIISAQRLVPVLLAEYLDIDAEVAKGRFVVDFVSVLTERAERTKLVAAAEEAQIPGKFAVAEVADRISPQPDSGYRVLRWSHVASRANGKGDSRAVSRRVRLVKRALDVILVPAAHLVIDLLARQLLPPSVLDLALRPCLGAL